MSHALKYANAKAKIVEETVAGEDRKGITLQQRFHEAKEPKAWKCMISPINPLRELRPNTKPFATWHQIEYS